MPNYFIRGIFGFNDEQIKSQKIILNKKYKQNSKEIFINHIIKIIESNDLKVLFAIIKNENISTYPLNKKVFKID